MFFRRQNTTGPTFEQRLEAAQAAGFSIERTPAGVIAKRGVCAATLAPDGSGVCLEHTGPLLNGKIGKLVDGGFQKQFQWEDGAKAPALARQLKALHAFETELRAALGANALYNEALGTVNEAHRYDRVRGRE